MDILFEKALLLKKLGNYEGALSALNEVLSNEKDHIDSLI